MTSKNLTILAGATAILAAAAYFLSVGRAPSQAADGGTPKELFEGLDKKSADVARVEIQKGDTKTVLVKDASGKAWLIENKGGFPAKFDLVRPVVAGVIEARILEPKTSKAELYDKLEVGDPSKPDAKSTLVTLKSADGKELASLIVGKRDWGQQADPFSPPPPGKSRHYIRKNNDAQSYLAEAELEFQPDPLSFADRQIVELKRENVKSASVAVPGAEKIEVARDSADAAAKFTLRTMPPGRTVKDEYATSRVANALSYTSLDDVRPIAEVDFSGADAATYEARCFDGSVITVKTVSKDGKTWASFVARMEETAPAAPPAATPKAEAPAANATADISKPNGEGDEGDAAKDAKKPGPAAADSKPADLSAPDDAKKAEDARKAAAETAKKQVADWNAKWSKWAYALPQSMVDTLHMKIDDLLAPKTAEQNPPSVPAAPPDESSLIQPK